jgi:hypothetical protein
MSSKEEFVENIKQWVICDNQINNMNDSLRTIRNKRSSLTTNICEYMESNSITQKKIEINNCTLKYCEKKEYTPLTFNYIKDCLTKIIDNDDDIEYIMKYLKENREIKVFSDIRKNSENKTQL